jgi:hypothetical protein
MLAISAPVSELAAGARRPVSSQVVANCVTLPSHPFGQAVYPHLDLLNNVNKSAVNVTAFGTPALHPTTHHILNKIRMLRCPL